MIGKNLAKGKKHQWVFCFIVACFFFSINLGAQNYPPLVSEAQALTMLDNEIPTLENVMNNLNPGSPAFILAERTYVMHIHAWESITTGRNVTESLTETYGEFAIDAAGNDISADELPPLSKNGPDYGDPAFDSLVSLLEL